MKHKLFEISAWPPGNDVSSSNTLNFLINCCDWKINNRLVSEGH